MLQILERWQCCELLVFSRFLVMARCLSVCLSLCVCHKSVFCRTGRTNRVGFWRGSFLPTLRFKDIQISTKIRVLPSGTFFMNFGHRKFCCDISIVVTCYQLSSRKVDAQIVINWTVIGQLITVDRWQHRGQSMQSMTALL